ncbi:pumilio homolog 12-like [Silene latifolia]|uniref:pumilio homolog 12-like n=1 Tax=Silene latifolia TaxID=37657 RepID=UPI003D7891C7
MVLTIRKSEGGCEDEGECSTRYAVVDERQQLEHDDDESYSSIMGLGNLTLSDNHTVETRIPNQSLKPSATASAYWPDNVGMPVAYDPDFTTSQHHTGLQSVGMDQLFPQPGLFTAPSTSNVDFQPQAVLVDIFKNPYKYMTSPTASRCVSALLDNAPSLTFIDNFVRATLQCKESLVSAACTYQGTLVIQKLICEAKNRPIIARLPLLLSEHTVLLMTNKNGMHVVKQCFVQLDYTKHRPLHEKLMEDDNWMIVARDMTGCRGLNSCIDYMEHSNKYNLVSRIAYYAAPLAMDVYANYVVQHVIDMQTLYTGYIVKILLPLLDTLCTVKNGSHLLEKCLSTPYFPEIVQKLLQSSKIIRHATHEYANYVIQKALLRTEHEDTELYIQLINILCKHKNILMMNRHGRYVARLLPVD